METELHMINRYSKKKIEKAVQNIEQKLPDRDVYNGQLFQQFYKANISRDFTRKSLKRIFQGLIFRTVILINLILQIRCLLKVLTLVIVFL